MNTLLSYYRRFIQLAKQQYVSVLVFLSFCILGDILFLPISSDIILFTILILFGVISSIAKLNSRFTFSICLCLLGVMFMLFLLYGPMGPTEKAAVWLVLFMIFGIIQQWRGS